MTIRYPDLAALILRIGFGSYMLFGHGLGKFTKLISGDEIRFPEMFGMSPAIGLGLAVFAEFFACIFIIIGFKTRLAAMPMVITMAVAAFYIHGSDAWFMQATDGSSKEPAMLYLIGFASIFLLGSGKYSLDDKISSVLH